MAALSVVLRHFTDAFDHAEAHDKVLHLLRTGHFEPWFSIVLFRLSPLGFIAEGHAAVVLFFVLSGFALTTPYLSDTEINLERFAAKRVVRLYPPYLLALAFSVGAASVFSTHGIPILGEWFNGTWNSPITVE